jgi:hypothetical protein
MILRLCMHAPTSANGPTRRSSTLAANAAEGDAFELDAVLSHQRALHAVARAEPEHAPSAADELRGDGEARKT